MRFLFLLILILALIAATWAFASTKEARQVTDEVQKYIDDHPIRVNISTEKEPVNEPHP